MHFSDSGFLGMRKHPNFLPSFSFLLFFSLSPLFSPFFLLSFSSSFPPLLSLFPPSPSFFPPPPLKWPYGRQLSRQLPTARPAKCFSFSQSRPQILKQLEPITFAQSKTFHQSRQKSWRATSGTRQKFWRATLHCLR